MDSLHLSQVDYHKKIKQCFKTLKLKPEVKETNGAGEAQLNKSEHYFACAEELHQKPFKAQAKNPEHSYFTKKLMDSIGDSYYNARGHFND